MKRYYPVGTPPDFSHSGDYGDTIFSLATVKAVGGADRFILSCDPYRTVMPMTEAHASVIAPLLEAQPYIGEVLWSPAPCGSSLDGWRDHLRDYPNLISAHGGTRGIGWDVRLLERPWLIAPCPASGVGYVFVRTARARGEDAHWHKLVELYGHDAIFLGLQEEHEAFTAQFGHIPWVPTANFLEAANIIAGCKAFFGNQTALHAIAVGLGKPIVREAPREDRFDTSRFFRENEISVYEGESISQAAVECLRESPLTTTLQRRVVPSGWVDTCWIGDHYWHRYNLRDLLSSDTYRFRTKLLELDLRPRKIVDIGGFIGLASWAMHRIWPDATQVIYEPNVDAQQLLWLNNPSAKIVPAAVHPSERWLPYSKPQSDPGCNHCLGTSRRTVPAVWLDESDGPIDVIKTDCEGGEWEVLAALHTLENLPKLIFGEYHGACGVERLTDMLGKDYTLDFREDSSEIGLFWALRKA
jgi:FkbM family methyltransferase